MSPIPHELVDPFPPTRVNRYQSNVPGTILPRVGPTGQADVAMTIVRHGACVVRWADAPDHRPIFGKGCIGPRCPRSHSKGAPSVQRG